MFKGMILSALALCFFGTGCLSRAVKESFGVVRGGKGVVVVNSPIVTDLSQYGQFEVEPFSERPGTRVPARIKEQVPVQFERQIRESKIIYNGDRRAILRGEYLYYEDANNTTDQLFGPFEEVIAWVEMVDAETGAVLGQATCVGRSTETVNKGPDSKAAGLAKAMVRWIEQNTPGR